MVARDQRNESPWSTPVFPSRAASSENLLRDSHHQDIFFNAFYEPELQKVLQGWTDDLKRVQQDHENHHGDQGPTSSIFGPRDGKVKQYETPETFFEISVMGESRVGKTTFIARALGIDVSEVDPPVPRPLEIDGETYYFKIREKSLVGIDPRKPETVDRARKEYVANPERFDGVIALYDVTCKDSLVPLPFAVRATQQTGHPCYLAATKADCAISQRQLDYEGVDQKIRLVANKVKSLKPTSHPDGPFQSLRMMLFDLVSLYQLPSPSASRQRSKSSLNKLQISSKHKSGRPSSKSSPAPHKTQTSINISPPLTMPQSPLPHYIAVAVDAASQHSPPESQASPGSEPFSPLSPRLHQDSDPLQESDRDTSDVSDEPHADNIKALPSHVLELHTFEELIARICFRDDPTKDTRFDFDFLAFYRFFARPLRVLNALITVFDCSTSEADSTTDDLIASRVLQFLSQWVTTHPGDFAEADTLTHLEEFLELFDQSSPYFPVAEQIRMASGKVDKDDDNLWVLPDVPSSQGKNPPPEAINQEPSAARADPTADSDAKLIFRAHSSLSEESSKHCQHTHTNSVDQSTIPYNISTLAQRQSALLDPSSKLPFTKIQWREVMALPEIAIAFELTRIDWIMFTAIQPRDMVRHITVRTSDRCQFRELSNVTRWVEHFNHVAYWTTNLILFRNKPKHRAQALEKLILVGRKLRELNNYNSLGAVVAGIQAISVYRLTATRDQVPPNVQKNLMKLELLMSTQKGHSAYRLAWENSSGPRIPFLPLHRRDLVVAEQGNKTWITVDVPEDCEKQERRINWNKFRVLGGMLWDLYQAQSKPYSGFVANEGIRRLLLDGVMVKDDEKLYERSLAVEPSGSVAGVAGARRRVAPWLVRYGLQ
ncbi:MAG: hypothetical protein Q9162_007313 [Coniocarpon cinnabarinum]